MWDTPTEHQVQQGTGAAGGQDSRGPRRPVPGGRPAPSTLTAAPRSVCKPTFRLCRNLTRIRERLHPLCQQPTELREETEIGRCLGPRKTQQDPDREPQYSGNGRQARYFPLTYQGPVPPAGLVRPEAAGPPRNFSSSQPEGGPENAHSSQAIPENCTLRTAILGYSCQLQGWRLWGAHGRGGGARA